MRHLYVPVLAAVAFSGPQRSVIGADVARWDAIAGPKGLLGHMARREFRNLLYHRLSHSTQAARYVGRLLRALYRPEKTLYLNTADIGPGLYIQHGFATIVAAKRVGANVWINQQVTIGFIVTDGQVLSAPTIEDGATIYAGAKVLGGVRVGRDATVGANAVVVKSVPDGMTAVGVPAENRETGRNARSAG